MGEKVLKLADNFTLTGDLTIFFRCAGSPLLHETFQEAEKDHLFNEDKLGLAVFGRIWSPEFGGGPHGSNTELAEISFSKILVEHCTYLPTKNWMLEKVFTKKLLFLMLEELKKFKAEKTTGMPSSKNKIFNKLFLELEDEIETMDCIVLIERFFKKTKSEGLIRMDRSKIKTFAWNIGALKN